MYEYAASSIVLVDASPHFRTGACDYLRKALHVTVIAGASLAEILQSIGAITPHLALIGPDFSEHHALALCRDIFHRWPEAKVIIVNAAADDLLFQVDAARAGASASLTPNISEQDGLVAVSALLVGHCAPRRGALPTSERQSAPPAAEASSQGVPIIVIGSLKIDMWMGHVRLAGTQIRLSRTEFRVLLYLAQHAGRAVPAAELLSAVWGSHESGGGTANRVKSCVRRLREKIELDAGHPQYILTVRGGGYLMPKL